MIFEATNHPPGSDEKLEVMSQRVAAGLPIHHKDDVTFESESHGGHSCRWLFGDGVRVDSGEDAE